MANPEAVLRDALQAAKEKLQLTSMREGVTIGEYLAARGIWESECNAAILAYRNRFAIDSAAQP